MNQSLFRPTGMVMVALLCLTDLTTSVALAEVNTPDRSPPVIELEAVAEGQADQSQVFTAQVVDDRLLKDVTLYHRRAGQQPFTAAKMSPLGNTGYYTVSLETKPDDLRTIEYYLQARDEGGNRTVSGFAFDPYQRVLTSPPEAITQAGTPGAQSANTTASANSGSKAANARQGTTSQRKRWVQVALGVLAVGALASLAGGSGGGSDADTVELNINLREPGT